MKLSVILAVKNEEKNLPGCLVSVKSLADETLVVDDGSTDKTVEIAKKYGAKVYEHQWNNNFHENKKWVTKKAKGDWLLYLDADEQVSPQLADDIRKILKGEEAEIKSERNRRLFARHQKAIEKRDKARYQQGEPVGYFTPRRNYFLGKPLTYAGVYPDGVIRLVKRGRAYWPAKSVHETIVVEGPVGWLEGDLEHHESPTLSRYLVRANRYTDYTAKEFEKQKLPLNVFQLLFYSFIKPAVVFLKLYFRNKGFLDGMRGFLWSAFSALHFPIAYFKYYVSKYNKNNGA